MLSADLNGVAVLRTRNCKLQLDLVFNVCPLVLLPGVDRVSPRASDLQRRGRQPRGGRGAYATGRYMESKEEREEAWYRDTAS